MINKPTNKAGIHLHKSFETINNRKTGRFSGYKTIWYWNIFAANGKEIARSSETYSSKRSAVKSIKTAAVIMFNTNQYMYYDHSKPNSPLKSYL